MKEKGWRGRKEAERGEGWGGEKGAQGMRRNEKRRGPGWGEIRVGLRRKGERGGEARGVGFQLGTIQITTEEEG